MAGDARKPNQSRSLLTLGPICLDALQFERDGTHTRYPGGNAVITGSILAAMGIETSIFGVIGDDVAGDTLRSHLQGLSVDLSLLYSTRDWPTKIGENVVGPDGTWRRDTSRDAKVPYLPEERELPNFAGFTHLYIGALNSLLRTTQATTCEVLSVFREQRGSISVGLAGAQYDAKAVNRVLRASDTILCNADEFCHLHGKRFTNLSDLVSWLFESRYADCVVTLGERGAIARLYKQAFHVTAGGTQATVLTPAQEPEQLEKTLQVQPSGERRRVVENTVGAGDVFAGVFIASRLEGFDLPACLRAAAAAASLSVLDRTWDAWMKHYPSPSALIRETECLGGNT